MEIQKKITICSSMSFVKEIDEWRNKMKQDGYDVIQYPKEFTGDFLSSYKVEFTEHFQKMSESDIVLILNMKKNGLNGYIGAAVFAEISFAIGLNRTSHKDNPIKIYHVNTFPDSLSYIEELQHWISLGWLHLWSN